MLHPLNRRSFIQTTALGAVGAACGGQVEKHTEKPDSTGVDLAQEDRPKMSIVSWANPQEDPEAIQQEAQRLTEEAIKALGGMSRFVSKGDIVWVKPNMGWDRRPEQAANTNPDVVATLVRLCYEAGAKTVRVSDHTCADERRTFLRSGIQEAAEAEGAEVFFLDRRKFKEMDLAGEHLKSWPLYVDYVECDKRINVPIAKHHYLANLTLSIKNLMGVMDNPRNQLHQNLGLAMGDVAAFLPSDLVVLDAVRILKANGPTGGNINDVERRDTVAAGVDTVAIDAFGATLFDLKPEDLDVVRAAVERNIGTKDFESLSPVRLSIS
ncbi:MAG: DUF362 domain-containing protein [bacterium]